MSQETCIKSIGGRDEKEAVLAAWKSILNDSAKTDMNWTGTIKEGVEKFAVGNKRITKSMYGMLNCLNSY